MQLTEIHFPVFRLLKQRPQTVADMSMYENTYLDLNTANEYTHSKIIDDTSIDKPDLATRRLHLESRGYKLYPLKLCAFFLHDFLKLAGHGYWFIDSSGKIFKYRKTRSVPLRFYKVSKVIPSPSMGSIIEVEGIPSRYKTMTFLHDSYNKWAGFLWVDGAPLFYGVFDQQYRNTHRMI